MISKTVKYVDYDGNQCEETLYFHLNKSELLELQLEAPDGFENYVQQLTAKNDRLNLAKLLEKVVLKAYGVKTSGKTFLKSKEVVDEFHYSPAFDELFMQILSDENELQAFLAGCIPADVREKAEQEMAKRIN